MTPPTMTPAPEPPPAPAPGRGTASEPLFGDRLADAVARVGAPVAVGLDPHLDRLPASLQARYRGLSGPAHRRAAADAVWAFCEDAIGALAGVVAAIKPQVAFFEALGAPGVEVLERVCATSRSAGLLVVLDAKRGDIRSTGAAYATATLDPAGPMAADAVTLNPWMGTDTLEPFLPYCREAGRGLFVLVRTTNPGSREFQLHGSPKNAWRLADRLAELGADTVGHSGMGAVGAVVGATAARDAVELRARMPAAWFLVPGVGAQGGGMADGLAGRRADGLGSLIVSSRAVLFPPPGTGEDDDPRAAIAGRARTLVEAAKTAL